MDFESTYTKEDVLTDNIRIFPSATSFVLNSSYLHQLPPVAQNSTKDNANIQFAISEGNISWRLHPGLDFKEGDVSKRQPYQLELHLLKIGLSVSLFANDAQFARSISLKIRDIEVFDRVPKSKFRKFFCYQTPDFNHPPRETDSDMIHVTLDAVRVEKEELRLKIKILPVELHIDQDLIVFLESFFGGGIDSESTKGNSPADTPEKATRAISSPSSKSTTTDSSFFQYVEINPISIRVDYKPKHVDYSSFKQGELMQLVNFIHLDEAKIFLNGIKVAGVRTLY